MIEYILLSIIILQLVYMIFKDFIHKDELEKLQLKLMSENVDQYKGVVDKKEEKIEKKEEDPYVELDEVNVDKLIKAHDNL